MESHNLLSQLHLPTTSYGTGSQVRLPGKTSMEPKIFKFGTPYEEMYDTLVAEDISYFTQNGIIPLCIRGASIKTSPTRWQDTDVSVIRSHDVVVCFEERIFDAVIEDLQLREPGDDFKPVFVICLDTKDNPTESKKMGRKCCELCWRLERIEDLSEGLGDVIEEFGEEMGKITEVKVLYQVCYL
ncbi:hypothetical protein TL16_g03012, partial [Triparma laevis f. inornata]